MKKHCKSPFSNDFRVMFKENLNKPPFVASFVFATSTYLGCLGEQVMKGLFEEVHVASAKPGAQPVEAADCVG